jgi:hypothetical protein
MSGRELLFASGSQSLLLVITAPLRRICYICNANGCAVVRFLDLIKPFTPLLPEVAAPETKVPFNQKLMWTGVRTPSIDQFLMLLLTSWLITS